MIENNFYYQVEENHYTSYDCENYGCNNEGICRCSKIENAKITSVNINKIVYHLYDSFISNYDKVGKKRNDTLSKILGDDSVVDTYCFYRISVQEKLYNKSLYEVITSGGYYGEEIESIQLDVSTYNRWLEKCEFCYNLSTIKEKLDFVLKNEYGNILPDLIDKNYVLEWIDKKSINLKGINNNHISNVLDRIKNKKLDFYTDKNYELPRGIVKPFLKGYRIIDGYHRISSSEESGVLVYVAV